MGASLGQLKARPHWGLDFGGRVAEAWGVRELYPEFDQWLRVYKKYNGHGVFSNDFTRRMGFDRE